VLGAEWIQLARDRDRWRATVNTVMNLRVLALVILLLRLLVSRGKMIGRRKQQREDNIKTNRHVNCLGISSVCGVR
jgi:hypothetical protein